MLLGEFVWKFKLLAVNYVARLMYICIQKLRTCAQ